MARQIFAYIKHNDGVVDDTAQELAVAASKIDVDATVIAIVTGSGNDLDLVCNEITSFYKEIWKFNDNALSYPNAEIIRKLLADVLPKDSIVLVPHCTFGMDLAPGLSIKLGASFVPDIVDIKEVSAGNIKVVRQEFGGMVSVNVECDISGGAVLTLRPGSFQPGQDTACNGKVTDNSSKISDLISGRKFVEVVASEAGDVDITKSDVLVSIGRGIEDEENIEIAHELADALGAVVSCSRPIVDAKWMDKSRQVGTSGQTVKPKVYLACGISGSFQHIGGLKGSPFVIAINKNRKAPIFQIADVGVETDILDFLPELTEAISDL